MGAHSCDSRYVTECTFMATKQYRYRVIDVRLDYSRHREVVHSLTSKAQSGQILSTERLNLNSSIAQRGYMKLHRVAVKIKIKTLSFAQRGEKTNKMAKNSQRESHRAVIRLNLMAQSGQRRSHRVAVRLLTLRHRIAIISHTEW